MRKRKWLSFLLAVMMLVSAMPFSSVTAGAADGTVEVSTWDELKRALDYTTNCSVVKVIADIETKDLNGHTGLHQNNIIFMTMAMDKVLDLNGHTVNAYVKYYSEVGQGYLINIRHKDARLTIRDSVGGGALIGEFNQEFYYQFINVDGGTLVMESGTVKILCPSNDNQYTKCAIGVSGTAVFNGGEVLTQVTSPGGEKEERYLSRRLQAIRGEAGGSVTINGGTFDRVVLHSAPTPENRGKYELVVNGGFFRQSIALILTGDVYASNFDHLPMQINDAYFMRTTDKLDPCRLVLGGKMKNFYDNNWDYDIHYNDIPGATLDDAKTMMWGLVPHLISENGAVFTDVHDGNWYVRGNMRLSVENGGPTMAFQGTSLGIQGGIAKVISNAYGVKEVLLDGEPMEYGERGFSAPQVDTTAEQEHRVSFVMYPISPMLRVLGYSYSNEYSTGYIRMFVSDHHTGQGMVHFPSVPASGDQPFSVTYYINESDVDALTTMELQYDLMLETNGVKKQVSTGYKGAKVVQWVDHTQTIDTVYLDISQPLVQGDSSSGTFTVDGSAPYAIEEKPDYWTHDDWDLKEGGVVPAMLGDSYYRFIRVYLKDGYEGYKFDKKNPPKIKIRGLNRECDSIDVRVANDERSMGVSLASHPSEVIQSAWGTVAGLRAGSPVGGVNIQEKGSDFELNMDLSVALIIAASFAILCTFYIGKRILTIDFSEYSSKNSKKAKLERLLVKKGTPLQNSKIRRDIRKAFERILIPLGNADQDLLPARMDMAFRNKIVSQINRLNRNKLCRRIYITDVVPVPKNDFETWNNDGREWRESVLKCSTLERFESTEDNKVQHEIYRKNSYLRILQSRHVRSADRKEKKKSYYFDMLSITCPSCGAGVKLDSQQVTCEYCGAVIKNEFYDWQTEAFEIYEAISTNLKRFVQLLVSGSILFLCVFLCLYLIEDTEISLAAGVGAAVLTFGGIITPIICGKIKQEKLAGKIVRYSENYLRACLNEHFWENENDEDLLDFSVGTIKLLKVAHTKETTTVTADIFGTKTFLPENQKPYTENFKKRLIMQRARYPEKRKADGEFFTEKDCPSCGANFMPDENHCCSFCGFGLQVNNAKWIVLKNN